MMASTPELMIIVMGATGAGKSTFLKLLTGKEEIRTSDLECGTEEVEAYRAKVVLGGIACMITFVDTPGFGDDREGHDDASLWRNVTRWLARAYEQKIKVAGVIYLQRITDERQTGTMRRSLKVLQKLIGEDKLAIAHMVTSRWEVVKASGDQEKADKRERMLLGDKGYWHKWFGKHGAGHSRHDNTQGSAVAIIERVLQNTPAYIQIQTEIIDQKMALGGTPAGRVIISDQVQELQENKKEIIAMEQEEVKYGMDPELQEELRRLRERIESLEAQKQKLETESNQSLVKSILSISLLLPTVCTILIQVVKERLFVRPEPSVVSLLVLAARKFVGW